jgi:hypothetical protein
MAAYFCAADSNSGERMKSDVFPATISLMQSRILGDKGTLFPN